MTWHQSCCHMSISTVYHCKVGLNVDVFYNMLCVFTTISLVRYVEVTCWPLVLGYVQLWAPREVIGILQIKGTDMSYSYRYFTGRLMLWDDSINIYTHQSAPICADSIQVSTSACHAGGLGSISSHCSHDMFGVKPGSQHRRLRIGESRQSVNLRRKRTTENDKHPGSEHLQCQHRKVGLA